MSELIDYVPSDPELKQKQLDAANEIMDSLLSIDSEKDQIKAIKERVENDFGFCPKFIDAIAKVLYDDLYNQSKANSRVIERAEIIETFTNSIGE